MQSNTFLSDLEVADRYRVNRVTIWRWVKSNHLPSPKKLSPGCTRWRLEELEAWEMKKGIANGQS